MKIIDHMKRRSWTYCQQPTAYEIECDLCGGSKITWSEYVGKIWCYSCQKDTPGTPGVFDGPIPIQLAEMMGMSFDRIDIKTRKIMKMVVGKSCAEKDGLKPEPINKMRFE